MKKCTSCQYMLPDNFITCPNCGVSLPPQPDAGSVPMQFFMYDEQMGKKIHAGESMKYIVKILFFLLVSFVITLPTAALFSGEDKTFAIILIILFIVVCVAFVIVAIISSFKGTSIRTAYVFYNDTLYQETLASSEVWVSGGNVVSRTASMVHNQKILNDLKRKSVDANVYLHLFSRYANGEKLWNPIYGGDAKIDALKNFKLTGENKRQYKFTYINEKGKLQSGKILKCYPNIETIFSLCR